MLTFVEEFRGLSIKEAEDLLLEFTEELLNVKAEELPETSVRVETVEDLTESFFYIYEEHCNQYILSKLTDYLLLDFIKVW